MIRKKNENCSSGSIECFLKVSRNQNHEDLKGKVIYLVLWLWCGTSFWEIEGGFQDDFPGLVLW